MDMPVSSVEILDSLAAFRAAAVAWLLSAGLRILLILLGSFVLVRLAFAAIRRIEVIVDDGDPHLSEREKRARTLAAILRKVAAVTVAAVAVLTILQELGVDTRAIITAAGIGGLAVGFGAQNLVRDVISGFFMLMENQIRIGDVVTINDRTGVVEDITLRITVLRDFDGTAHIFPNGAIQFVSNQTKDWSRAVVDVPVAYREDADRVMGVLGEVGNSLLDDPKWRPFVLEPPQVLGITEFGASGITIRMAVTTRAQKHIDLERELRRRIKSRFDREGIEIPYPHVSLHWGRESRPIAVAWVGGAGSPGATSPGEGRSGENGTGENGTGEGRAGEGS